LNYYPHHIGDYETSTAHLTWVEDAAYLKLIRLYYRRECPIPGDIKDACRLVRARSRAERDAVQTVLKEFFLLEADGWHQSRCDGEIQRYQLKVEHNRRVGLLGGRPRKGVVSAEPIKSSIVSDEANHVGSARVSNINPLHSPETNNSGARAPAGKLLPIAGEGSVDEDPVRREIWRTGLHLLQSGDKDRASVASFLGRLVKDYGPNIVLDAMRATSSAKPFDAAEYLTACCLRASGQRRSPVAGTQAARVAEFHADLDNILVGLDLDKQQPTGGNHAASDAIDVSSRVLEN
jgi:hypothetical protein